MNKSRKNLFSILFLLALFSLFFLSVNSINGDESGANMNKYLKRIFNRETPPVYKDWNNYPDIKDLDKYKRIAKLTVSWETIGPKGDSGNVLGLSWDKTTSEYPMLTKKLTGLEEAEKIYKLIHSYNPNTMLGVEIKWDAVKDYELPPDHKWWKRDDAGNRIPYSQPSPPRFEMNVMDTEYIKWVGERCKAILDTGFVDFIFFDHIKYIQTHGGDPLPFLKGIREIVGTDAIIIGNTHFDKMAEISKYLDAWGEVEKEPGDFLEAMLFWETNGRKSPRFNCWEFMGQKDDYKAMRYYTTLVMTNTNASVRYIDHNGSTKPSPWYDFWDVKIGMIKGEKILNNNCFTREYSNGTTVCNDTGLSRKITFNEKRKRASTGEEGTSFTIPAKDGDMFLFVK